MAARTSAFIDVETTAPGANATLGMMTDWVLPDPGGPITRAAPRALAETTPLVLVPKKPPATTGTVFFGGSWGAKLFLRAGCGVVVRGAGFLCCRTEDRGVDPCGANAVLGAPNVRIGVAAAARPRKA